MPLNTDNESNIPENSEDTTQRLEKYGVWVKKAPHEVNQPQEIFIDDEDTTLSVDELSGITSTFSFVEEEPVVEEEPGTEEVSLEDFGIEEQTIPEDSEEELPDQQIFDNFDEEMNSLIAEEQELLAPKEITETEEFIIDNGGAEAAQTEVTDFSPDDVLSHVMVNEETSDEVDFSQFKSFDETFGNISNPLPSFKDTSETQTVMNEDDTIFTSQDEDLEIETITEQNIEEEVETFITEDIDQHAAVSASGTEQEEDFITENSTLQDINSYNSDADSEVVEENIEKSIQDSFSVQETALDKSDLTEDFDFSSLTDGEIDLSAFMDDTDTAPKPLSGRNEDIDLDSFMSEGSTGGLSDGDIDLSAFMNDSETVNLDSFIPSEKKKVEIADEPPLEMSLAFDDEFAGVTKADPVNEVETISIDSDGLVSGFSSFDDIFDEVTDESEAITDFTDSDEQVIGDKTKTPPPAYDDASEFDDLLSSLDDTPQVRTSAEENKPKTVIRDYDLSVNLEDNVDSVISEKEEVEETEDSEIDDISLFTGSEDGSFYKELEKSPDTGYTIPKVLEAGSDMEFDELDDLLKEADLVSDIPEEETISFEQEQSLPIDTPADNASSSSIHEDSEKKMSNTDDRGGLNVEDTLIDDFTIDFDDIQTEEEITNSAPESNITIDEAQPIDDIQMTDDENFNADTSLVEDDQTSSITEDFPSFDSLLDDNTIASESDTLTDSPANNDELGIETDGNGIYETVVNEQDALSEDDADIESEIDIEIPQDTIYEDTNTEDLDDLLNDDTTETPIDDITESSFDEDIDQELELQETIDQEFLEETPDDETMNEQEIPMDSDNNPLLDKIAEEISVLRAEINSLKNELSSLKHGEQNVDNTVKESGGFFSDDEGDDTIALSGDELNNILINADFTEEYAETSPAEHVDASSSDVEDIHQDDDRTAESTGNELSLEKEAETENADKEQIQLEPFDPFGSVSDVDSISDIVQEEFYEDEAVTIDENLQEPSPEELSIDAISFTPVEEETEAAPVSVPNVEDIIVGPSNTDLMDSMDEPLSSDEEVTEEIDDEESFDEPVETVFESSQWDSRTESLHDESDQVEDTSTEEIEHDSTPVITESSAAEPVSPLVPKELQQDIKSVLLYMDQLLENLPEDKIEEFARSEHFNVYKKLFSELGLV